MKLLTLAVSTALVAVSIGFSAPAWSYDEAGAQSYAEMFAPAQGKATGKKIHLIPAEKFVDKIKTNQPVVVLDVRTPRELGVFGSTLPGTLNIPLNELFNKNNLASIPTDKPVVVLCQSGVRSTAVGTALRHIGFKNVFILKGGYKALIHYLGPKQAYTPVKKAAKK